MAMNAVGTFNVTRLAAAAMASLPADDDGQRGVVVNTASIAGMEGQTGQVAYAAAKAAILGYTKASARELGPEVSFATCDVTDEDQVEALAASRFGKPVVARLAGTNLPAARETLGAAKIGLHTDLDAALAEVRAHLKK